MLDELAARALAAHARAYPARAGELLPVVGLYAWRRDGEHHQWNPETIALLQHAVRAGGARRTSSTRSRGQRRVRAPLDAARADAVPRAADGGIPLDEVEPASEIVKRFSTGAMSLGSLSREAHETLAMAMNRIGGRSNTGEGGEDPVRFATRRPRRSKIKQVASGRFGVNIDYLTNADELQIKMAQGAKPGEGGQLPGHKVDRYIAGVRFTTPGVGLISPPPHHDIYSIEDLKQLIYDLRCANPEARISVKLVSEVGVGTVAAGVAKANADHVLISGHDGGTGASPLSSILHAGVPWEIGLAETQQTLVLNDLRSRIWVQTDGQLKTGRDVVVAALLGADEMGFATAPLIATGCVMMRACHLNTCPVGIATQDPELRKRFAGPARARDRILLLRRRGGAPDHGAARRRAVRGPRRPRRPARGRRRDRALAGARRSTSPTCCACPTCRPARRCAARTARTRRSPGALDWTLIEAAGGDRDGEPVDATFDVRNVNRTVGGLLSNHVTKRTGAQGCRPARSRFELHGSAGQSFGAWLAPGIDLTLDGDANDYVGKGLSGGTLAVRPPDEATFLAEENVIVGNTVLYGATAGPRVLPRPRRRALRRAQLGRIGRRRGRRRPRLRVHDRRPRRRARADRAELRGRHERRHRLRPRRGRRLRGALQHAARRARGARGRGRRRPCARSSRSTASARARPSRRACSPSGTPARRSSR